MDETRLAELECVTNDLINRRAQPDYDEAAWDAEISFDTVLELLAALRDAWAEVQRVAGGALVEEAETSVRRIHAEVERDVARQALTSSDAMNRHWDEINAERDRLAAQIERVKALADEWEDEQPIAMDGTRWRSQYVERLRAALDGD